MSVPGLAADRLTVWAVKEGSDAGFPHFSWKSSAGAHFPQTLLGTAALVSPAPEKAAFPVSLQTELKDADSSGPFAVLLGLW